MRGMSIALVLLLALAMGCASTLEGKKIDGSKTKNLLAERTTPADVVKMFGEPQQKETLASGETKYVYYYRTQGRMLGFRTGQPRDQQRLEVFIKSNQVDRYRYLDADQQPITTDIPPLKPEGK
jgi:ligand-binding sensor domain-containing protein